MLLSEFAYLFWWRLSTSQSCAEKTCFETPLALSEPSAVDVDPLQVTYRDLKSACKGFCQKSKGAY